MRTIDIYSSKYDKCRQNGDVVTERAQSACTKKIRKQWDCFMCILNKQAHKKPTNVHRTGVVLDTKKTYMPKE
jgi:hypothetical protein